MTQQIVRSLLGRATNGELVPCMITQVSPLLVSLAGADDIPGEGLAGLFYTVSDTNNAYALIKSPGLPLIFPIG